MPLVRWLPSCTLLVSTILLLSSEPVMSEQEVMECLPGAWGNFLDPGPQDYEFREEIPVGDRYIAAFEFPELKGEYAKVFIFLIGKNDCFQEAVSIGSYSWSGALHDGEGRLYHADFYDINSHSTLGFYEGAPPTYEEARQLALETFQ